MRILLTGATGFVGGAICRCLLDAGHQVRAVARRIPCGPEQAGLEWVEGDFARDLDSAAWLDRVRGVDAVVNAVGIIRECGGNTFAALHTGAPVALFQACVEEGVGRVVQISAMGVAHPGSEIPYQTSKLAADEWLASSGVKHTILRPSLVQGEGGESFGLFCELACLPIVPILGKGDYPMRPLQVDDLARAVRIALEAKAMPQGHFDVGGSQVTTLAEMLLQMRAWLGHRAGGPCVHIPRAIVGQVARLGDSIPAVPIDSHTWKMLQQGSAAPITRFEEAFGFTPTGLTEHLARTTATPGVRWKARLGPYQTPIRLLVASVWLITPIVSLVGWHDSLRLLSSSGVQGALAPALIIAACAFEFILAGALIIGRFVRLVGWVQICLLLVFTLILSATQSELWMHPFGPLSKNLPLIAATLAMIAMADPE